MDELQIGRLVIMNRKTWAKFRRQYRHFGHLLHEMIVKDLEGGEFLVEMSRLGTIQEKYEKEIK